MRYATAAFRQGLDDRLKVEAAKTGLGIARLRKRVAEPRLLNPIVTGGRSSGARVACRTAAETDSVAVACLAFPLHPPGHLEKSRLPELDAVYVPTLVVQGENETFGTPPTTRTAPLSASLAPLAEKQRCCCGPYPTDFRQPSFVARVV
jgi:predicted alpha/beta-hydrolase family hydrolase